MMRILTIMILLIVVGCSSRPAIERHSDFAPVRPLQPEQTESSTGSIFTNRSSMSLFEGQREWYIGDIVTIVLSETAQASRNTNLSTERSSSNDVLGTKGPNDLFPTTGFIGKALPQLKRDGAQISSEGAEAPIRRPLCKALLRRPSLRCCLMVISFFRARNSCR